MIGYPPKPSAEVYKEQVKETYLHWRDLWVRIRGMSEEQIQEVMEEGAKWQMKEW